MRSHLVPKKCLSGLEVICSASSSKLPSVVGLVGRPEHCIFSHAMILSRLKVSSLKIMYHPRNRNEKEPQVKQLSLYTRGFMTVQENCGYCHTEVYTPQGRWTPYRYIHGDLRLVGSLTPKSGDDSRYKPSFHIGTSRYFQTPKRKAPGGLSTDSQCRPSADSKHR
jgi:hypothetical protein